MNQFTLSRHDPTDNCVDQLSFLAGTIINDEIDKDFQSFSVHTETDDCTVHKTILIDPSLSANMMDPRSFS